MRPLSLFYLDALRGRREIACSMLSLARSAQAERDNKSCFFLSVHGFARVDVERVPILCPGTVPDVDSGHAFNSTTGLALDFPPDPVLGCGLCPDLDSSPCSAFNSDSVTHHNSPTTDGNANARSMHFDAFDILLNVCRYISWNALKASFRLKSNSARERSKPSPEPFWRGPSLYKGKESPP
ncbi:hypothetical protein EVAR_37777_1 [Eumeta japonica]|uniref:Uncharacterized protein n=1 Tax=Eumeta variegata TaxID=151549 RepID=A0A4C1WPX6_EUMVA|nr:hypothetical protein EVAR_37777_1 [Eumeta japonica]